VADDRALVPARLRAGHRGHRRGGDGRGGDRGRKGAAPDETLRAIRAVARGEAILGPGVADRLQRFLSLPPHTTPDRAFPQLSLRELEILHALAQRKTNAQIAAELFLSQKTVRNYVSGIFAKLHVADRAEAGQVARAAGLVGSPPAN
jgi:DNA-binding NarL/FixJ family response regulator